MEKLKVKCMFDHIIVTATAKILTEGGLVVPEGTINTKQKVLVKGPMAPANIEIGDEVELNMERFPKINKGGKMVGEHELGADVFKVMVPVEVINGVHCIIISPREIKWIYETPITNKE